MFFGAWVTLEDEDGDEVEYRIVGPDEIDAARATSAWTRRWRALMRKALDDEVRSSAGWGEDVCGSGSEI